MHTLSNTTIVCQSVLDDMSDLNWERPMGISGRQALDKSLDDSVEEESRSTTSAFTTRRRLDDQGPIWRTRSLDETGLAMTTSYRERCLGDGQRDLCSSPTDALHSSFDTALLEDDRDYSSIFRFSSKLAPQVSYSTTWNHQDDPALGDLSGRKHLLQQAATETTELNPPGTVRKLARHHSDESAGGKTPVRPQITSLTAPWKGTVDGSTPSTVRRRRTPVNHRKSPLRRVPPATPREPSLQRSTTNTPGLAPPETPFVRASTISVFGQAPSGPSAGKIPQATTPTRKVQAGPFNASTIKSSKVYFTGTTAASTLLETTVESESIGTSSPSATPFRFTSFPASLPRVNNPRVTNRPCSDSIRKRMSFGEVTSQNPANQSKDDDNTNNTSISSLSADGAHHVAHTESNETKSDALGDTSGHLTFADPVHTKLFDDAEYGYSSDDDSTISPRFGTVSRTRLNFNVGLSPPGESEPIREQSMKEVGMVAMPIDGDMTDLSHPYEQRRTNSFPSSLSSHTPLRNVSGCDEIGTASTVGLTPSRSGGGSGPIDSRIESHRPQTPQEVQLHFQLNAAQCSPIPGVREEEVGEDTMMPQAEPCGPQEESFPMHSNLTPGKSLDTKPADGLSISQDSGESSSASSGRRRLRPMPDMSAFENDASSRNDYSCEDSAVGESKAQVSSPKLLCPPTPVRTPAWAHNDHGGPSSIFPRSNSLTSTRVLATCSPLLLDQRYLGGELDLNGNSESNSTTKASVDSNDEPGVDASFRNSSDLAPGLRIHDKFFDEPRSNIKPPQLRPRYSIGDVGSAISFATDFQTLRLLGRGTFADVYKVRSKLDRRLYAIKRNRRQFRGKRDRDNALAEVRSMQRLQSVCSPGERDTAKTRNIQYLLFFFRAWQEDGHFFCQTELCCRDTCCELMDSLRSRWNWAKHRYPSIVRNCRPPDSIAAGINLDTAGRLIPEMTVWKVCHDIGAGLSHIHSQGLVHADIKPSNIFFVPHGCFGALCKIGDFGMAADIGTSEDGQEGDQKYMAPELLTSGVKNASADIFSLGLTLYELASDFSFELPSEGPRWHELRSGSHAPQLPSSRTSRLVDIIRTMVHPSQQKRPCAEIVLKDAKVKEAGSRCDEFLRDYIMDIDEYDRQQERRAEANGLEDKTPRNAQYRDRVCSPILGNIIPTAPNLFTPEANPT